MTRRHSALLNAAMLRWIDELSTQGIFTTDENLIIRSWNRWLERTSGRPAADMIGQPLLTAYPEVVDRGFQRHYEAALTGSVSVLAQPFHRYLLRFPPGGASEAMPQSWRIAPLIENEKILGTLTVIDDLSELVKSEAEMRRQIASAVEARIVAEDALRIKDEFLATLSHEIRTPLNAVIGWTKILLARPSDGETLERALRVIDRNATAQARLIEDMLDMARIVSGKLRLELGPVDLVAATISAIDVVAPAAAAKSIQIRTSLSRAPRAIVADADRIQQIVWNVLSNAVKFTPSGGVIDVTVPEPPAPVQLTVKDTGEGIASEFLPHVFERFRQANASSSRSEGGLGLGLALVRQLVEMHGGEIGVESEGRGAGASFTITFPEPKDARVRTSTDGAASPGRPLAGVRVMVVDDDADWRELMVMSLSAHGGEVVVAGTTRQALTMLDATRAQLPHVIVADLAMPGEDGYALMDVLRASDPPLSTIPAIAVSAYSGADHVQRAIDAGFRLHRAKPIAPDDVTAAVLDALRMAP
ncbi:MAG: ATP-binding protein [Vicinamibacterales bacterium]